MNRFFCLLALLLALTLTGGCGGRDDGRSLPGGDTTDGADPTDGSEETTGDGSLETNDTAQPDGVEPGDATDVGDTSETTEPVVCAQLEGPTDGSCSVTPGSGALRLRGLVLAPDTLYEGGEVLVDDQGEIVCVGCDCGNEPESDGATVVTCPNGIVSPGLINAHEHLGFGQNAPGTWGTERFDHRHDWRKGKNGHKKISVAGNASVANKIWCELRHVLSGCTSIAGSDSSDGFLRNVDGSAQHGLAQPPVDYQTFPLGDNDGEQLDAGCGYPKVPKASVFNGTDCYFAHVAEGINAYARNEYLCLSSADNGGVDVTTEKTAYVHMVGLTAVDGADVAASHAGVVWSPRSNVSLYGNTTPVTMYATQGVLVGIGTDWSASGSMNLGRELACALSMNEEHFGGFFTTRDLWKMATVNNATILALNDRVGTLEAGLVADIAIFASHGEADPYRAILTAGVGDTRLVLRGGEPLYGDADLVAALPSSDGCPELTGGVCGVAKRVCVQREVAQTWDALASANSSAYALFYCGAPDNEPTCVPMRPGEYTGEATPTDGDGDGVPDTTDDCPTVFNPARPVDGAKQADADSDGVGDLCDPCPLNADTTTCAPPNPDDRDGDGVTNASDNCPMLANPDQLDTDNDGKGDACDACPDQPNPGAEACTASIYDVKTGVVALGSVVKVTGVVTAVAGVRFFVQVPETAQDATLGATFSGLYVYVPTAGITGISTPKRGDLVAVTGSLTEYYGELELENLSAITVLASDQALPTPVTVEPAAVGTGGADAKAYEGVLVTVVDGEVTDVNPAPGTADDPPTNEYVLDGALRVNDFMFLTDPFPAEGGTLTVTGILRFANDNSKLEPRDADDVVQALGLRSFGPSPVFVYVAQIEAATLPPLTLTLTRPAPVGGALITLESSADDRLAVPASVTVPAGLLAAEVLVDALQASDEPVAITATFEGVSLTAEVRVLDPNQEPAVIGWEPSTLDLFVGAEATARVLLDIPARPAGTVVTIATQAGGDAVIDTPDSVTVPAGALGAEVTIAAIAEGQSSVTASTSAGAADLAVDVSALPKVGLVLSEVFYNPTGVDDKLEWVEIYNGTGATVDLAGYSLGWAGTTYTDGRLQLAGTLDAGQCAVIGGPTSSAVNVTPTFFQAVDFNPDIQNSGNAATDKADAVALFAVPSTQIAAGTVPIDAVIYGTTNGSNLKDETGSAGAIDIKNVAADHSLERVGNVWTDQAAPTPNDCAKVLAP